MNVQFEANKLILTLAKNDKNIPNKLRQFGEMSFGSTRYEKFIVHNGRRVSLEQFAKTYEEMHSTPEMRRISNLEQRVNELEQRMDRVNGGQPIRVRRKLRSDAASLPKTHPAGAAIVRWYKRLEAGETKALKINAILQTAGISIIDAERAAHSFSLMKPTETRSVVAFEEVYDRSGEEGLRAVATLLMQLEPSHIRLQYIEALDYALHGAPKPLHSDAVFSYALDYFHMPWPTLREHLHRLRANGTEARTRGEALGKLVTREIKL